MISVRTVFLLSLAVFVSCLPPPSPRSSPQGAHPSGPVTRADHRLDILGLSRSLSAAVAPILDAFLTPLVESLPEEYLDELAYSIKKEKVADLGPDPLNRDVRYFDDEDKLQAHQDFKKNAIS